MRCRECAARVAATARVCSRCGAPIVAQPPVVADTVMADTVMADTMMAWAYRSAARPTSTAIPEESRAQRNRYRGHALRNSDTAQRISGCPVPLEGVRNLAELKVAASQDADMETPRSGPREARNSGASRRVTINSDVVLSRLCNSLDQKLRKSDNPLKGCHH